MKINRAFFGKENCFKLTLNKKNECYFHFGIKKPEWIWKKVKLNDIELGDILLVLNDAKKSTSFFHNYKDSKTQIWINRSDKFLFLKVKELTKSLSLPEQSVFKLLIEKSILEMNYAS